MVSKHVAMMMMMDCSQAIEDVKLQVIQELQWLDRLWVGAITCDV